MLIGLGAKGKIDFRIIEDKDHEFLYQLYASTRAAEMDQVAWTDAAKRKFLRGQFNAQTQGYATSNPGAKHRIIQLDQQDIGRLIVDRQDDVLRLMDLSILPIYRSKGIGTDILRGLINEAHGGKVPIQLHVHKGARATNLYLRHGFQFLADRETHFEMEWRPDTGPRQL